MTKDVIIEKNTLLPEEYIELRAHVQWGGPEKDDAKQALENSLVVFTARVNGKLAGSVRIIGDNKLCFYIQDLMVFSNMRMQGIATKLIQTAMQYISAHAAHNAYIGLMSAKGLEGFYEKFGFMRRPNEKLGCGMIMFYGRPAELTEE